MKTQPRSATSSVGSIAMFRCVCRTSLALLVFASIASAQESADSAGSRAPRFLLAAAGRALPVDISRTPLLRQHLSLELNDIPRKPARTAIAQQSDSDLVDPEDV